MTTTTTLVETALPPTPGGRRLKRQPTAARRRPNSVASDRRANRKLSGFNRVTETVVIFFTILARPRRDARVHRTVAVGLADKIKIRPRGSAGWRYAVYITHIYVMYRTAGGGRRVRAYKSRCFSISSAVFGGSSVRDRGERARVRRVNRGARDCIECSASGTVCVRKPTFRDRWRRRPRDGFIIVVRAVTKR